MELDLRSYDEVVIQNGTPFPFATDSYVKTINKVVKKYILNLQTLQDVERALQEDMHLYEILKSPFRKLYIDIDHITWKKQDIYEATDLLIQHVYTLLGVQTTMDDVVLLVNEPIHDTYNSLHIIFPISMHMECQKRFVEHINQSTSLELDDSIYTKNRLMRCIRQSKMIKAGRLIALHPPNPTVLQTLIHPTQDIPMYTFKKQRILSTRSMRMISTHELVQKCLTERYDSMFSNSNVWCRFTSALHTCNSFPMDVWLRQSAEICPRYTYDQNLAFLHTIEDYPYDENYFFYLVNKYTQQDVHYIRTEHSQTHLESYLSRYFTDIEPIVDLIINGDREQTHVFVENGLVYQLCHKTAFITNEHGFKINYHYDLIRPTELKGIVTVPSILEAKDKLNAFLKSDSTVFVLKSAWGTGKTQHIFKETVYQNRFHTILVVTSSNALNRNLTALLNDRLCEAYYQEGCAVPPHTQLFHSHLETNVVLKQCKKVVCSIQSLHKVDGNIFDVVVIDEYESVMNAFYADKTFKQSPIQSFHTLQTILRNAGKIIVLDADISKAKVDLLKSMVSGNLELYKNQTKSFQSVQFTFHDGLFMQYVRWILYEAQRCKLVLPCASRKKAQWILHVLGNTVSKDNMLKHRNAPYSIRLQEYYQTVQHNIIGYIDCNGIQVFKTNGEYHVSTFYERENVYDNIDAFIQTHCIDILIYTPSITTGISMNRLHFDKAYAIASCNSVNTLEFIQMLMRNRNWTRNEVHVYLGDALFQPTHYNVSIDDVLKSQSARASLINQCKYDDAQTEHDIYTLKNDPYCTAQIINMCNHKNTRDNFTANFISVIQYHALDYNWNTESSPLDVQYIEPESLSVAMADMEYKKWTEQPFLSFELYVREYARRVNHHKLKPKLSYTQEHLQPYYDDPDETIVDHYYKLRTILLLLNLPQHSKFIQDTLLLAESGKVSMLDRMHQSLSCNRIEYVNTRIQDELQTYDVRALWDRYIHIPNYKIVSFIKRFMNDPSLKIKEKTYTEADSEKLNSYLLSLICQVLDIHLHKPSCRQLTNKEFTSIVTPLQTDLSSLYAYIQEKDLQCKPTTFQFRKAMYQFTKERLKALDYGMSYDNDKNTHRDYDTMTIAPKCMTSKFFCIQYDGLVPKPYALLKRFPHLQDKQQRGKSVMELYKEVVCLTDEQVNILLHKLNQQKTISPKDKKALCKTLLLREQTEANAFQSYYHNDLYYMQYDPNLLSLEYRYYTKSGHQKTFDIELFHATINTYVKQNNVYVKSTPKIISRPYIPISVVIPHTPRLPCLDFLFNRSNVVSAGRELKSKFPLKSKFQFVSS